MTTLTLHQARFSALLDGDHHGATMGLLGGILETDVFVDAMHRLFGAMSRDLCSGATWTAIENQLRSAQDIMLDGVQNPSATCNAISIGLGFHAAPVRFGAIAPPKVPPPDPCR